ncbi:MAG: PilZ domain-containing protein [Chloroflexi bacterium]|nr:PilZ domain-containing protein [Chloroflexota bacterium]
MDRREQYRIVPDEADRVWANVTGAGGSSISGQVLDISAGGVGISVSFPLAGRSVLAVGEEVAIAFTSTLFEKELTVSARVVHRAGDEQNAQYGFRFSDPQPLDAQLTPMFHRLLNRRRSPRVTPAPDFPVLAILSAETGHTWTAGQVVDISNTGIGVIGSPEIESRFGSVERVELSVSLPGHADALRLHGVIRNRYTVRGQIRYGIDFEFKQSEESQRNQAAIINYVEERQGRQSEPGRATKQSEQPSSHS